jgi:hypothetical protein
MDRRRFVSVLVCVLAVALVAAPGVSAEKVTYPGLIAAAKTQLGIAVTHANLAACAATIGDALWHIEHVIYCLEGPRGPDVILSASGPCRGRGSGILPDLRQAAAVNPMPAIGGTGAD